MKIPQSQYLHSQSFRSDLCEFVWRFPQDDYSVQFILQVRKELSAYIEVQNINGQSRNTVPIVFTFESDLRGKTLDESFTMGKGWSVGCPPDVYKNFQNGKELIPLVTDVLEFLK